MSNFQSTFFESSSAIYIVMGSLSGMFVILPRLVMHKTISTFMDEVRVDSVKNKANFNLIKVVALNLSSISGGAQFLMLLAILLHVTDLYTICYFIVNFLIMIFSLKKILNDK